MKVMFFPDNLHYTVWGNMLRHRFVFQEMAENIAFRWYPMSLCTCLRETSLIIIIREICIAPFPEVNQTKGALQKIEKQFTQTAQYEISIYSEWFFFIFAFYLPKQNRKAINPHPGNRKGNEKRLQKTPTRKQAREYRSRKENKLKIDWL